MTNHRSPSHSLTTTLYVRLSAYFEKIYWGDQRLDSLGKAFKTLRYHCGMTPADGSLIHDLPLSSLGGPAISYDIEAENRTEKQVSKIHGNELGYNLTHHLQKKCKGARNDIEKRRTAIIVHQQRQAYEQEKRLTANQPFRQLAQNEKCPLAQKA